MLKQQLQAWDQESNHGERFGPFAKFKLTGADVYWLAAQVAGDGDIAAGRARLAHIDVFNYVILSSLHLESAYLQGAQLQGVYLGEAQLQGAYLTAAQMRGANLIRAQMQGADLGSAQMQGALLLSSDLRGSDLRGAKLDGDTQLIEPILDDQLRVADVAWNGVPLNQVDWDQVLRLGDEQETRRATKKDIFRQELRPKYLFERSDDYQTAARAYRQLAIALRGQGITGGADRFSYRALIMSRKALWWQMRSIPLLAGPAKKAAEAEQAPQRPPSALLRLAAQQIRDRLTGMLGLSRLIGPYLFSWFLAVLTGYGFRMSRIVVAYLLLICGFAAAYWSVGVQHPRDISFWTALIVSVTAFHGRVFTNPFAPNIPDVQVVITAIEAICRPVIEGVFIAMLTQRFFNR